MGSYESSIIRSESLTNGISGFGQLLVVAHTDRGEKIRIRRIWRSPNGQQMMDAPDEVTIEVEQFNRQVITEEINRVVCEYLAENIDPSLPGKTLIFCVNDSHPHEWLTPHISRLFELLLTIVCLSEEMATVKTGLFCSLTSLYNSLPVLTSQIAICLLLS